MGQYESITETEKQIFIDSWSIINKDLNGFGIALFNAIFIDFPLMANYFPFAGPSDELFERHAQNFMVEMNMWVWNLRNLPELKNLIGKMGANHAKRNIPPEEYDNMMDCFITAVVTKIGEHRFRGNELVVFRKIIQIGSDYITVCSNRERIAQLEQKIDTP